MASSGRDEIPVPGFHAFMNLPPNEPPLQSTEVLDEQTTVQVIDLVIERACQESLPLQGPHPAVEIHRLDDAPMRTPYLFRETRQAQAAFVLDEFTCRFKNPRVDQNHQVILPLAHGKIDDGNRPGHPDLVGGEADAGGDVHRFDHVLNEPLEIGSDPAYRLRFGQQDFVRISKDRKNRHGAPLCTTAPSWRQGNPP